MRKLKLFLSLLMLIAFSVGNVWATDYELVYTLDGTLTNTGGNSNYAQAGDDVVQSDIHWSVTGNLTQNPWRIGGKNLADVDREAYSKTAISDNIAKIEIEHGTKTLSAVNSMTVIVASNSDFSTVVSSFTPTFEASKTVTVTRPDGKDWSNCYYKIVYNVDAGSSNSYLQLKSIKFYKEQAASDVATPTFSPEAGVYTSAQSVTLSCETASSTIYYTTDGSDPDNTKTQYTGAINVSETQTIKAIAYVGSAVSNVASATYTIVTPLNTMDAIFAAATAAGSTATDVYIDFQNWVVSGAKGNTAYVTDGTKGFIIYYSGHGFNEGDILSGTGSFKLKLYSGAAEITAKNSGTITATPGGSATLNVLDADGIAALSGINTGSLIKISGAATATDVVAGIKLYKTIYPASSLPSLSVGANYNCTGVYVQYSETKEMMPRKSDDIAEIVDPGKVATPTFSPEGGEFSEAQNVTITCETEDATIYYTIDGTDPSTSSSVYSSAIEVSETTTIKAFAVKDGMTDSDIASATYTISGPQVTFNYVDYKGEGTSSSGSEYTMVKTDIVSIGDTKFYGNNNYAHFYANGVTTITPASGVTITQIVLTASETNYNGYQSSGTVTASAGSLSHEGKVVTWTGSADAAFTITHDKQIRWISIVVSYEEADPSAPALAVDPTVIDFGDVEQGSSVSAQTVAVNFANLTGEVTYSGLSSPFSATGTISATGDLISISADATVEVGEYEQTLTVISAADSKSATVTVTMNVVAAASGDVYNKLTGSIEEGDYVIFYDGKALKNTIASNRFGYEEVTPVNNKISDPDASIIWSISQSGEHWTIYNENVSKYAGATGSNNQGALLSEVGDKALWSIAGTGEFDITNKYQADNSKNAYLRNNGTYGFACYAEGTGGKLILYKAANSKAPAGLAYAATTVEKLVGAEAFTNAITNPNGLTVAYSSNNTEVATVDAESGAVTIVAAGFAEITATTSGDETHKAGSAQYTICVTAHSGTEADPYTVADAKIVIDALGTKEGVYATGIICQVDAIDLTENFYATYWISADGLTTGQKLEAYHGKYLDNANFSSEDEIKTGDEVIIYGNLKKFSSTYEFDGGNYLTSLSRTKVAAGLAYAVESVEKNVGDEAFTNTLTNPYSVTVTYSSSAPSVASVDAASGEVTVHAMGEATITATFAGNGSYLPGSASYTISVNDPSITKVTFDATEDIAASGELELSKSNVTLEFSKGVMDNGTSYRLYKDAVMTLTCADGLIVRVELEDNDGSYPISNISGSGYSAGVWTGSAESVELEATEGQTRISKVNVYYQADSREAAGLAYAVTAIEKNEGDAKFTNELTNPNSVTVAYSSSNASVASVDAETGEVTIVAAGEAIITASFAGNTTYKSANVSYTITVSPAVVPPTPSTGTTYRKVTATADITDGEYLIVYEGDATHDAAVFDGSLDNDNIDVAKKVLAVEIENDEIAGNTELDAAVFTIDVTAGSLQSASGLYIGRKANSNGMDKSTTEAYVNTFAITDGEAVITGSAGPALRYNYASDQLRFRYYKSGQQAIQLYKKVVVEPEPQYTEVRADLTAGWYYTMCLDKAVTAVQGGTIWRVLSKAANGNDVILEEVTGTLDAGRPYIFRAAASTLEVAYTGDAVGAPVNDEDNNGLVGSFSQTEIAQSPNNFIIYNNALYYVNSANVYVGEHRAYLDMTGVPAYSNEPQQGAPRRRVTMAVYGEQTATGMDALNAADAPVKMMINGQLFILRGEKMYDATGRLVK